MDLDQNIGREAGSVTEVAFKKKAKDILDGESFERKSVTAPWNEEIDGDVKDYEAEINELACQVMREQQMKNLFLTGSVERGRGRGRRRTCLRSTEEGIHWSAGSKRWRRERICSSSSGIQKFSEVCSSRQIFVILEEKFSLF